MPLLFQKEIVEEREEKENKKRIRYITEEKIIYRERGSNP
jgi:hypothetical protein